MLVPIGKGLELEVDVTRFNSEVRDHVLRTGLRNSTDGRARFATAKAYPDDYLKRSREMAEKKLANLYAGVTSAQSFGGPKAASDPISQVIMRLARKAVSGRPEIAAASKADRLATINRLAAEYAKDHDAELRPRALKIAPWRTATPRQCQAKARAGANEKEAGGLTVPATWDFPHFMYCVESPVRPGAVLPR